MAKRFVRSPQKAIWEGIADKSVYNDSLVFIEDAKEIWSNGVAYKPDFYYIEGTGSTAGTWLGSHVGITEYYPGLTIAYKVPVAGATTTTLKINSLAAITVAKNSTTAISTAFPVGSIVILTYTLDGTTAYWKIADQNSTYNNASLGNGYTTCTTAAGTAAKTASLSSYSISTGGSVSVKFDNEITVANPTLNINSKGAKAIYYKGAALTDTSLIGAGDIVTFVYSTLYHIVSIVKADLTVLLTGDVVGNVTADLNKETITIETSLSDTVKDRLSTIEQVASASLNDLNDLNADIAEFKLDYEDTSKVTAAALNDLNSRLLGITDDLNFLPLTGGTLTGDLFIGEGSTALLGTSQGRVTLYNDTHLDFNGESGTTTMGLTESGFIISNDGELKLSGDSIVINAADSLYFSGSSDATFTTLVHVDNEVHAQAFFQTSDARKKDIQSDLSLDKCYDLIDKCQTVIYSLKDQTKEQVGMIAQEIEEFFPEVVATDEEGFKSLAYDRLVVICFKVLKDVIKRLEKLENNGSN